MEKELDWIISTDNLPTEEGYYRVKFSDGTEDEKPFRIRPSKNIYGFMTDKNVVAWKYLDEITEAEKIVWNNAIREAITKIKLASIVINKERVKEFVNKLETLKMP